MAAPLTAADEQTAPADRPVHVVCCDPNEALCGTNVSALLGVPDDVEPTCVLCALAYANGLPCANPECPE
ncbi:hypothetical protein [Micromonospora sp. WMMD998]|uniref:hypothetical protein n=1 Tax=Micromonospora sp. WMMD998 TaxID=3016092 RepID=UPI00249C63CC|nr:hypothetical protein [Micromonospora sp. WMMD998]WFE41920.1 hypothetical protein O7619_27130 [Micromonospora sp. WMMD998]